MYFVYKVNTDPNITSKKIYLIEKYHLMAKIGLQLTSFVILILGCKYAFSMPRPICTYPINELTITINPEAYSCLSSLPSGHTSLAAVITYLIITHSAHPAKYISLLIPIIVGITRITLALHYPADIIFALLSLIPIILIGNLLYILLKNNLILLFQNLSTKYLILRKI